MAVRPHPTKGPGWWYVDIGRGKARQRIPVCGTVDEVLRYEEDVRRSLRPAKASCFETVAKLMGRYLDSYAMEHLTSGAAKQRERARIVARFFGACLLQNITPPDIERYKAVRLADGVKHSTVNKELSVLSGLMRWAVDMGILTALPVRIRRFPPKMTRAPEPQVPGPEVVAQILRHLRPEMRGMFQLMAWLGLRSSEARMLRAEHWDSERRVIRVQGKGGKERRLPVASAELAAEIDQRAAIGGYLWVNQHTGQPYTDIRRSLKNAAIKAGWTGKMHPHLLRHYWGTEAVGVADLRTVQAAMGHATIQTTEGYVHVRAGRLRAVMEDLEKTRG